MALSILLPYEKVTMEGHRGKVLKKIKFFQMYRDWLIPREKTWKNKNLSLVVFLSFYNTNLEYKHNL